MITNETIQEVATRSMGRCENFECRVSLQMGYENHHIFWRSQYRRSDRDDSWNIAALCRDCHRSIHYSGNVTLDKNLKLIADRRRDRSKEVGNIHRDIVRARVVRKNAYKRSIERFKNSHEGLSPTQVAYRNAKKRAYNKG